MIHRLTSTMSRRDYELEARYRRHAEFQRIREEYYRELGPIITEMMKLDGMFHSMTLYPDGTLERHYPEKVIQLRVAYDKLVVDLRNLYFGGFENANYLGS